MLVVRTFFGRELRTPTLAFVLVSAVLAGVAVCNSVAVAAQRAATRRAPASSSVQRRLSCHEMVERVSHGKRVVNGTPLSLNEIARELGTNVDWLEQCLIAYGRRVPKRAQVGSHESAREDRLERSEEEEAEEVAPEDIPEPGEGEQQYEEAPEKQLKRTRPTPRPRDLVF
jgi:hypothetical protein